jgi:DNA-directed RNA polymerase specialized sigma24 family protein
VLPLDAEDASETDENFRAIAALIDGAADPEMMLAKAQKPECLNALLAALPVMLRECLVLCDIEGLT